MFRKCMAMTVFPYNYMQSHYIMSGASCAVLMPLAIVSFRSKTIRRGEEV